MDAKRNLRIVHWSVTAPNHSTAKSIVAQFRVPERKANCSVNGSRTGLIGRQLVANGYRWSSNMMTA